MAAVDSWEQFVALHSKNKSTKLADFELDEHAHGVKRRKNGRCGRLMPNVNHLSKRLQAIVYHDHRDSICDSNKQFVTVCISYARFN